MPIIAAESVIVAAWLHSQRVAIVPSTRRTRVINA
jgi:hypothetical protein